MFAAVDSSTCWSVLGFSSEFVRTTDGGATWSGSLIPGTAGYEASYITSTDANSAWVAFSDPSGLTSGGVFKTTDGGASWAQQTTAFAQSGGDPLFIKFFDAVNGVAVGNPNGGNWEIYTTTNGGDNWTQVSSPNIPAPLSGEHAYTAGHPSAFGNNFWFSTSKQSLYKTTNRGLTWTVARDVFPGAIGMGVAFKDNLNGLLTGDGPNIGIRRTTDGGNTFVPVSAPANLTPSFITAVPHAPGSYVATTFALFGWHPGSAYTTDDGATWHTVDYTSHGRSVFISPAVGWSGSSFDSVYKYIGPPLQPPLSGVLSEKGDLPAKFELRQNYPNPFNPSTTMSYRLSTEGFVTLKVYDLLGREVATLVNEQKHSGTYDVRFEGVGLASGTYFYKLTAGGHVETRSMILMR